MFEIDRNETMLRNVFIVYVLYCATSSVEGSRCTVTMDCSCKHDEPTASATRRVAFHAQMSTVPKLIIGSKVLFESVDINIGDGYRNGIFTAPVDGLYFFSATVTASGGCFVTWHLEAEGKVYAKILTDSDSNASDSATGNAVILLKKGQKAYVKHYSNRCGVRCDVHSCPIFSGFLVN